MSVEPSLPGTEYAILRVPSRTTCPWGILRVGDATVSQVDMGVDDCQLAPTIDARRIGRTRTGCDDGPYRRASDGTLQEAATVHGDVHNQVLPNTGLLLVEDHLVKHQVTVLAVVVEVVDERQR